VLGKVSRGRREEGRRKGSKEGREQGGEGGRRRKEEEGGRRKEKGGGRRVLLPVGLDVLEELRDGSLLDPWEGEGGAEGGRKRREEEGRREEGFTSRLVVWRGTK
jgi:hypothetical protein